MSDLLMSVVQGDIPVIENLLKKGVDPDQSDIFRYTALMYAASKMEVVITRLLLDYGADMY